MDAAAAALIDSPSFAHVCTLMPDGAPHSVAVWITHHRDSDHVAFFTVEPTSRKARNLEADPRVAISMVGFDEPYKSISMRGEVVERLEDDEARTIVDAISRKYTGKDFPVPGGIVFVARIDRATYRELPFSHEPG